MHLLRKSALTALTVIIVTGGSSLALEGVGHGCSFCGHPSRHPWHYSGCRYYGRGLSSGGGSSSGSTTTYRRSGPSAAELAARKRQAKGHALNKNGCTYYSKGDWANAIKCFEEAVRLKPGSATIKKNLKNAKQKLQEQIEEENRRRIKIRKTAEAQRKIDAILDVVTDKIKPSESASPLSFEIGSRELFDGGKSRGDPATVDLRFADPEKPPVGESATVRKTKPQPTATANSSGLGFGSLDEPPVPGKPKTPEKPPAGPSRISRLSDKQLDTEIARLRKTFVNMKGDFQANVKDLQHWARESQEAQRAAIKASTDQLLGIFKSKAFDKLKAGDPAFRDKVFKVQQAAVNLQKELAKAGKDYAKSSGDRQARLQAAHAVLKSSYDFLSEYDEKISKVGGPAIALASYLTDYGEQATRWNIARGQIGMINDNLNGPGGKLQAQKTLQKFHEALIQERKRRRALSK
jgi:Tetratricopeptide repeat